MEYAFSIPFKNEYKGGDDRFRLFYLDNRSLAGSLAALDTHDFAVGPEEGGILSDRYEARWNREIFRNKNWSKTCAETMHELLNNGAAVYNLEKLSDTDHIQDVRKFELEKVLSK
ncbi:MAG: hypothetical protein R2794_10665 [Chitinophagales bacterium]